MLLDGHCKMDIAKISEFHRTGIHLIWGSASTLIHLKACGFSTHKSGNK